MNVGIETIDNEQVVIFRPKEHSEKNAEAIEQELKELGLSNSFRVRFKLGKLQVAKIRGKYWVLMGDEKAFYINRNTFRGGRTAWGDCFSGLDHKVQALRNKSYIKA